MKKQYLERLNNKTNVQRAMIILNKKISKYTRIARKENTSDYTIYNYWLKEFVTVTKQEFNYIVNKLNLSF